MGLKIAVIGAGVFGCTVAIKLSQSGHKVSLFEKTHTILSCTSTVNQYRLHRGYHYPRSKETVEYVKESCKLFEEEYHSSICREGYERYYAISSQNTLTTAQEYLDFLSINKLEFTQIKRLDVLKDSKVSLIVKVVENGFDVNSLYLSISAKLASSKVILRTNRTFTARDIPEYDIVINATYSNINEILPEEERVDYQFELCEKPVVKLDSKFIGKSIVVMDGEFCCVDPIGFNKDYQVLGHVKESIHYSTIGQRFDIPDEYKDILNKGRVFTDLSNFQNMWKGFTNYFNADNYEYRGSMFTIRTVLPKHEHDDARPSNIIKHSDKLYSIFSGKIGTCVDIANKITQII